MATEIDEELTDRTNYTRLSVNLNEESRKELTEFAQLRGLSYTEAIRRLIAIGSMLGREVELGREIQIVDRDANRFSELLID